MKTFRVGFVYEQGGYTDVTAETVEDAEEVVKRRLDEDGTEGIVYNCTMREWYTIGTEEVK